MYKYIKSTRQESANNTSFKIISNLRQGKVQKVALKSDKGQYLSAVNGGCGPILADKTDVGDFETFLLIPVDGDSRNKVAIKTSNGYFLTAVDGGGGSLLANYKFINPDNEFNIIPMYPNKLVLRSRNGHFIGAENGGGGLVEANKTVIGPWQMFTVELLE